MSTEARHLVLDLTAKSRNWALTPEAEQRVRAEAPPGWVVDVVRSPTSSDGDGPQRASEEAVRLMPEAEIYFGFGITRDLLAAGPRLRWVHSPAAGVGSVLQTGIADTDILLTNSAGVHGPPIGEFVLAGVLHFMRGFDAAVDQPHRAEWSKAFFVAEESPLRGISGARVLIVGTGGVGRGAGWRVAALGGTWGGLPRRPPVGGAGGVSAGG